MIHPISRSSHCEYESIQPPNSGRPGHLGIPARYP